LKFNNTFYIVFNEKHDYGDADEVNRAEGVSGSVYEAEVGVSAFIFKREQVLRALRIGVLKRVRHQQYT
jgi:hypothetical protein